MRHIKYVATYNHDAPTVISIEMVEVTHAGFGFGVNRESFFKHEGYCLYTGYFYGYLGRCIDGCHLSYERIIHKRHRRRINVPINEYGAFKAAVEAYNKRYKAKEKPA